MVPVSNHIFLYKLVLQLTAARKGQGDHGQSCLQGLATLVPRAGPVPLLLTWNKCMLISGQEEPPGLCIGHFRGALKKWAWAEKHTVHAYGWSALWSWHGVFSCCLIDFLPKKVKMLEFSLEFWSWDLKILQTLGLIDLHISVFPVSHSSLVTRDLLSSTYEIKWNKNHIKNYYHLTAISLHIAVTSWWISHLVQWMF